MKELLRFLGLIVLVLNQGDPSYSKREAATAKLTGMLHYPGTQLVLAWGEWHPDPEVSARCKALLSLRP